MEELKRKAFDNIDLGFRVLLKFRGDRDHKMVKRVAIALNSQSNLLLDMELITFDEWEFIYDAITFSWLDTEVI